MSHPYALKDPSLVPSPALLFYPALIRQNIARAIEIAGSTDRLRPHVKTHKTREIARMELEAGITKHKCATIAEAEMLASVGAPDVMIAYPLVGPNVDRLAALMVAYPQTRFSTLIDDADAARALSEHLSNANLSVDVFLDVDCGQHRTGIAGAAAAQLYELATRLPGLNPVGLHVYDGHNHQPDLAEREAAVEALLGPVKELRSMLEAKGLAVPKVICGGTPTFPMYALLDWPGVECSPGTLILHDIGYNTAFPDMTGFTPAAVILTRIISKPTHNRLTFDVGTKAVASDPPAGKRCKLLDIGEYQAVGHNEEHFVIETELASSFHVGDVFYAMPAHICPTCALYRSALVVEDGEVVGEWDIAARDRILMI